MGSLPKLSNRQHGPRSSGVVEPDSIATSPRVVSDASALAAVDENVTKKVSVHYAIVTTGKRYVYESMASCWQCSCENF